MEGQGEEEEEEADKEEQKEPIEGEEGGELSMLRCKARPQARWSR